MNLGIRFKLVIAFILVLILPVVSFIGGQIFASSIMENADESGELARLETMDTLINEKIVSGYGYINDHANFYYHVEELLQEYEFDLQILDSNDLVLFDSTQSASWQDRLAENSGFYKLISRFIDPEFYQYTLPVVISNDVSITAVITPNPINGPYKIYTRFFLNVVFSIALGLLVTIAIIAAFTLYFSRSVLKPLKELNLATKQIAKGNLDFNVNYTKNDELGQFCHAFETMRVELKNSLEKQALIEQSRREMIASISHDLRTPTASIKGYVEGLQDGIASNPEMFSRYLSVIKNKTDQLDRLIDDLSQYSRMESGKLEIEVQEVNSQEMLEKIVAAIEVEMANSSYALKVVRPFPALQIKTDQNRIEQLMDNLVKNAKTYMDNNGLLEIEAREKDSQLIISVADSGCGISTEDLPHIFDIFYRGEKSRSRDYGGTGLGLAICKHIITAHDGQIWAESTPGKGSCFYFSIPVSELKVNS